VPTYAFIFKHLKTAEDQRGLQKLRGSPGQKVEAEQIEGPISYISNSQNVKKKDHDL
jgi:hypothetical protein